MFIFYVTAEINYPQPTTRVSIVFSVNPIIQRQDGTHFIKSAIARIATDNNCSESDVFITNVCKLSD